MIPLSELNIEVDFLSRKAVTSGRGEFRLKQRQLDLLSAYLLGFRSIGEIAVLMTTFARIRLMQAENQTLDDKHDSHRQLQIDCMVERYKQAANYCVTPATVSVTLYELRKQLGNQVVFETLRPTKYKQPIAQDFGPALINQKKI